MADDQLSKPPEVTPVVVLSRGPRRPEAIDLLDAISHLMDRAFEIPGSKVRFGVNSLLLLMPGIGDVIAVGVSMFILFIGLSHYRVPRIVAARMVLNSLLDATISAIPLVGNVWDVWFKADTRNVNLLRQYVALGDNEKPPSTWKHWAVVLSLLLLCLVLLGLVIVGTVAVVMALARAVQTPGA
jgi:hypothetical protein